MLVGRGAQPEEGAGRGVELQPQIRQGLPDKGGAPLAAIVAQLRAIGYVEGENVVLETRPATSDTLFASCRFMTVTNGRPSIVCK